MVRTRFMVTTLNLVSIALASLGCASAPAVFGDQVRYSPAFNGYVMAHKNGSDDPGESDAVLLLRDPLTGSKLRCHEQVIAWRELYEDVAADSVHDENVAIAVSATTASIFAPLVVIDPIGALVLAEAILTSETLYDDFASDDATELLAAGIVLHNRKRYRQASAIIERALAKDSAVGIFDKAYFYLGMSYAELGHKERAALALSMFIDRAGVRDVDAYRTAAAKLKALGVKRARCGSTEPVELHW